MCLVYQGVLIAWVSWIKGSTVCANFACVVNWLYHSLILHFSMYINPCGWRGPYNPVMYVVGDSLILSYVYWGCVLSGLKSMFCTQRNLCCAGWLCYTCYIMFCRCTGDVLKWSHTVDTILNVLLAATLMWFTLTVAAEVTHVIYRRLDNVCFSLLLSASDLYTQMRLDIMHMT